MRDEPAVARAAPDCLFLLLESLRNQRITFCYFKSSRRIAAALAGDTDLDLLVARADHARLQQALLASGFKPFVAAPSRADPAVASFLGFDEATGRLLHVHLHFSLLLGSALLKNYQLPWTDAILASAVTCPGLPVRMLDPATETLLLVLRRSIELRRNDPVVLRNWRAVNAKLALDQEALGRHVDRDILRRRTDELLGPGLADDIAGLLDRPGGMSRTLQRQVRRRLSAFRRYNALEAWVRGTLRAMFWILGGLNMRYLHAPRPWSRRSFAGGLIIAVIGVDGSGKTTLTRCIRSWLTAEMDTMPVYFGTGGGRPSLLLAPLKLLVPLVTRLLPSRPKGSSHGRISDRPPGLLYSALLTMWATVLAAEKRLKLTAAQRAAARGLAVVTDRYPQDRIASFNDGPLLPRLRGLPGWLLRFEARAYARASQVPPDLVIKLEATPAVLAAREPDMDRAVIDARVAELRALDFPGSRVVTIDATQPLAEVIAQARREVWRLL
ncbi:hypothetical protein [Rhodopila globiformis]|uniref:hypothetical protein n=1 Tax=Rhodopila globiformis TaxID=1071 RepID=UPI001304D4B0|nr:hypothetical protein [Rhodopila globiformis]